MPRYAGAVIVLLAGLVSTGALAQNAPSPETLNDVQRTGQKLFYQDCGVCHTKPQINAVQFGPTLSSESAGGQEEAMRQIIGDGTQRMPGFKYFFKPEQIAAITSYLKVLPPPPAPPAPAPAKL